MTQIAATARGSGLYRVFVDGIVLSEHTAEREALENATEALAANPAAAVHYVHDYTVDVVLVADVEPEPPPVDPYPPIDPPVDPPVDPPIDPVPPVGLLVRARWSKVTPPDLGPDPNPMTWRGAPVAQGGPSNPPPTAAETAAWNAWTAANNEAALCGGLFWRQYCNCRALRVVPAASRGFTRGGEMLEIKQGTAAMCGNVELLDQIPQATTHWGRVYVEVQPGHGSLHGWSYNIAGAIQYVPFSFRGNEIVVGMSRDQNGLTHPEPFQWGFSLRSFLAGMARKVRLEWESRYVSTPGSMPGKVQVRPRIYDGWADDAPLVYTAADFTSAHSQPAQRMTLEAFYAGGAVQGVADLELGRRFGLGNEGNSMSTPGGSVFAGDLGFALDGWVGVR